MVVQDEVMKSRITLVYRTEMNGRLKEEKLPFRVLVTGDFSKGSSKDRQLKLAEREIRNFDGSNTDSVIRDMDIKLGLTAKNRINPNEAETIDVELPIDGIRSFSPDQVAQNIPQVRQLIELKALLQEGLTAVANKPQLAEQLKSIFSNPEALKKLKGQLGKLSFLQLPSKGDEERKPQTEGEGV